MAYITTDSYRSGSLAAFHASTNKVVAGIKVPGASFVGVAPTPNVLYVEPGGNPSGGAHVRFLGVV